MCKFESGRLDASKQQAASSNKQWEPATLPIHSSIRPSPPTRPPAVSLPTSRHGLARDGRRIVRLDHAPPRPSALLPNSPTGHAHRIGRLRHFPVFLRHSPPVPRALQGLPKPLLQTDASDPHGPHPEAGPDSQGGNRGSRPSAPPSEPLFGRPVLRGGLKENRGERTSKDGRGLYRPLHATGLYKPFPATMCASTAI